MISLLRGLLTVVETIGGMVLWAVETTWNLLVSVFEGMVGAVTLASLPSVPSPPGVVTGVNWFFPIGGVLTLLTSMSTAYVGFLGVRWLFKKVGVI
jgi:hypothetical protein